MAEALLRAGADPNLARLDTGQTVVMKSVEVGLSASFVGTLVNAFRANVGIVRGDGATALALALQYGRVQIAQVLKAAQAAQEDQDSTS